jgi:uncharacterized membrane protein
MTQSNSVVAIFKTHTGAESAVKELQQEGFDMKNLSIVGKDYHTDENVVGYYNTGDRMKYWGKLGAFWGGFWGLLFGSAFFVSPVSDLCSWRDRLSVGSSEHWKARWWWAV